MPWIVPARIASEISRFAWTLPNHLSMDRSSMTGGAAVSRPADACELTRSLGHVVRHLDLAGHDVGARLLQALLHLGSDQAAVVLIERVSHAPLGDAEVAHARLPRPVPGGLERLVDGQVDALDHRGQDRARVDVVLVAVDADGQAALVLRGLKHAEPGRARGRVDHVGAAVELAPRQLA